MPRTLWTLLLVGLAAGASPTHAAPVTWYFDGVVEQITASSPELSAQLSSLGVEPGAAITGSFRFETSTPDARPDDPSSAYYSAAIDRQTLAIGDLEFDLELIPSQTGIGDVFVSPPMGLGTEVRWLSDAAPLLNGRWIFGMNLFAMDEIFSDDSLPSSPPPLSSLDPSETVLVLGSGSVVTGSFTIFGSLTRLVPEPAASPLVGLGLAALAALRRRRSS